jgi:transposase
MWRSLGISESDWQSASPAIRLAFATLEHRLRLAELRCTGYEAQLAAMRDQLSRLDDLAAEVAELRERLGQNSSNSSRPPSCDPPSSKPTPPPAPSGRRRGAQRGHRGSSRRMLASEAVDHIVDLKPSHCGRCGRHLQGEDPQPQRRQVSDLPSVRAEVSEYRRHRLRCRACGAATRVPWPAAVRASSFGPCVQAVTAYLTGRLSLSHRDVVEAMRVLYGLEMSLGSVSALERQVGEALEAPVDEARRFVRQQRVQYVDETSWVEQGRLAWVWVNATRDVTTFDILERRASQQAKQVIDAKAKGVVTTDRYGAYSWLEARRRQICWAHLRRDFQAMVERGGASATIGEALLEHSRQLFALWHRARDGDLSRRELEVAIEAVRRGVRETLTAGTQCEHKKTRRVCAKILTVERSLWSFVRVAGVEPTNNAAERALRRAVLWRRRSFGTASQAGTRFVERILTAVTTLRQQGRDVLEYLTEVCARIERDRASALSLTPPSLLVPAKG